MLFYFFFKSGGGRQLLSWERKDNTCAHDIIHLNWHISKAIFGITFHFFVCKLKALDKSSLHLKTFLSMCAYFTSLGTVLPELKILASKDLTSVSRNSEANSIDVFILTCFFSSKVLSDAWCFGSKLCEPAKWKSVSYTLTSDVHGNYVLASLFSPDKILSWFARKFYTTLCALPLRKKSF